jgi:hypothetical protein
MGFEEKKPYQNISSTTKGIPPSCVFNEESYFRKTIREEIWVTMETYLERLDNKRTQTQKRNKTHM